jgi:L-amino acid N-acyltransferase YncA
MKAQGYHTVMGGIALPNDASIALHESFGMTQVAHQPRMGWKFNAWHDVGYWALELADHPDAPPEPIRPVREIDPGV